LQARAQTAPGAPNRPEGAPNSPFEDFFRDFFDRQQTPQGPARRRPVQSLGSGFIIDPSGIVVTNNHVVADAEGVTVTLADGKTYDAKIIATDAKTDLAVLKIDSDETFTFVPWGDSDVSRVGDWILAIGNPFGLGGTITAGIISARARNINAGPYDDFIQTDASINRGNSGGPMFNLAGEVIGINTAIFSPSGGSVGIGFAIPANLAKPIIDQLLEFGRTRRGWLGVRIQTVTDEIAEGLGLDEARGALVAEVTPGGPAEAAGLEGGDIVLTFDGKAVEAMRNLPRIVAETRIGKPVDVVVWRRGREVRLSVEVGELEETPQLAAVDPEDDLPGQSEDVLGMTLLPLSANLREQFSFGDDVSGVVITGVLGDSAASERGIRPGDIIVEVGQEEVSTPAEVASKVRAIEQLGRKSVLLLVQRGGDLRFVAVRLGEG
jgi:serine protease Do